MYASSNSDIGDYIVPRLVLSTIRKVPKKSMINMHRYNKYSRRYIHGME